MNISSLLISVVSLMIALTTAWLTLFRRGTVKMTQPTTIFFGPDSSRFEKGSPKIHLRTLGKIDGASGCVLRLQSGFFLVTAEHVLRTYEERLQKGERLNWQIGKLPPVDPLSRVAWRDKTEAADRSLMPYRPRILFC